MAGLPITEAEIQRAREILAANPGMGVPRLGAALGVTRQRAYGIKVKVDGKAGESKQLVNGPTAVPSDPTQESLKTFLRGKRRAFTIPELSEALDRSEKTVTAAIDGLKADGYNIVIRESGVELADQVVPGNSREIVHEIKHYKAHHYKFGVTGDNHLGSNHERLDVLNALYDLYESEGVDTVYNTGNWIEGEARFNRHDIRVFGMGSQVDYFVENYPQRKGITTYFVAGDDHEGWLQQREQIIIGEFAEDRARRAGREDLKYIGYVEADIELKAPGGSRWMKVMHPGGGSAYALSYAAQKLVESFQGGEKPAVLLYGHYHKFDYNYAREVHAVGTGCTVDQSIFMRKNKIQAHVGGVLIDFNQAPDGTINRFRVEWLPFYDRGYYTGKVRKF